MDRGDISVLLKGWLLLLLIILLYYDYEYVGGIIELRFSDILDFFFKKKSQEPCPWNHFRRLFGRGEESCKEKKTLISMIYVRLCPATGFWLGFPPAFFFVLVYSDYSIQLKKKKDKTLECGSMCGKLCL